MNFKTSRYKRNFYKHLDLDKESMECIKILNYCQEKSISKNKNKKKHNI